MHLYVFIYMQEEEETQNQKSQQNDHSKLIENYEEFEIALRNTPYYKYLHTGNVYPPPLTPPSNMNKT